MGRRDVEVSGEIVSTLAENRSSDSSDQLTVVNVIDTKFVPRWLKQIERCVQATSKKVNCINCVVLLRYDTGRPSKSMSWAGLLKSWRFAAQIDPRCECGLMRVRQWERFCHRVILQRAQQAVGNRSITGCTQRFRNSRGVSHRARHARSADRR
jgi:hypothetical protein